MSAAGRELILDMAGDASARATITDRLLSGRVAGVMVVSVRGPSDMPQMLADKGIPVVTNGRSAVPYVDVANAEGARQAVRRLVATGRREIATIAAVDTPGAADRLAGYRASITDAGQAPMIAVAGGTSESGSLAMRCLLADHPGVDAVFAASDVLAHGAVRALRAYGRRVPDDVAVIGFDDTEVARLTDPALTTVRLPIEEIGRTMARQIMRLAAGEPVEPSVVLDTELVARESG